MITGNDQESRKKSPGASLQPMLDTVIRFFEEDHWHFQRIETKPEVRAGYRGDHGTWVCYARANEQTQRFVFYAGMGLNIPPQFRPAVIEYLARVNLELSVGSFDMDM